MVLQGVLVLGLWLLVLLGVLVGCRKAIERARERWFVGFMTRLANIYTDDTAYVKAELFAPMAEMESVDPHLREIGAIRILEIGCGVGTNFEFFPARSHVIMLDSSSAWEGPMRDRLTQFPSLRLERFLHCTAEEMSEVRDYSVDAVVSTVVLCSVTDLARVLEQGGKFYFMEHVPDKHGTLLYFIQRFLTAIRVWPLLFSGCHLDRDLSSSVLEAGFSAVSIHPFQLNPSHHPVFRFIRYQIAGIATN